MQELKIVYLPPGDLIPYKKNAKQHRPEQVEHIANSIKEFGFRQPLVIDRNNVVVIGHGRLLAAKRLGLERVPCTMADDLTEEQIKALRLADNKTNESEWDFSLLESELNELKLDFDMADFGFDEPGEALKMEDVQEDDPDLTPPEKPITILGDIWQLGRHRLMCGDSTNNEDIQKLMNGQCTDMVFTDPPYQLETKGGGILKTANSMKQIKKNGVDNFDPAVLKLYGKTNVFCHNKPLIKKYIELAEKNKMPYDLAFYKKKNSVPNYKGHLMTDVEYIAIIGNQDPNKGLEKELYSKCFIGQKDSENELSYSKPVALCAKYIQLYSTRIVLDMFGGSGSTLIACEQLNRTCYMMELDPAYCDVIIHRWEDFTGKKAVRLTA